MIAALARTAITGGAFLVAGSLLLLLIVHPGTAQFVLTIASLLMGLILIGLAIPLVRRSGRRPETHRKQ